MEYPLTPPKRIFVTGAAGFIGTVLTQKLLARGCEVIGMSRRKTLTLPPGYTGTVDQLWEHPNFTWKQGDILNVDDLLAGMEGCDAVFHLAALIAIPFSYHSPDSYVDTNIKGTLNVLNAARELGTERIMVTSTSEVYGTAIYVPIDEKHPYQGQSPYSATKIGADRLAESFYRSFDLPVSIVRPFNTLDLVRAEEPSYLP